MKSKTPKTECSVTRDGYEVRPGDTVWVTVNYGPFERKVVGDCYAKKISYADGPDSGTYIGAKLSVVYKYTDPYVWKLVKIPCWNAPYWMNDGGEYWLNIAGGRTPKSEGDKVSKTAYGEYMDLDHKLTGLAVKESAAGWLSRTGRFFPCRSMEHEEYASLILHSDGMKLEERGWVRIYHRKDWHCAKDLSEEQEHWMSEHSFDPDIYNPIAANRRGC
jgi:hypothetical protein